MMSIEKLAGSRIIEAPFIRVQDNCLEFRNTFIQLSNISLLSTDPIKPKYRLLTVSVAFILAGCSLIRSRFFFSESGWFFIVVGFLLGYVWFIGWRKVKRSRCMTIITNSGRIYPIVFEDKEFMKKVVTVMIEIIQNPGNGRSITVNVNECVFSNDASVIDNMIDIK